MTPCFEHDILQPASHGPQEEGKKKRRRRKAELGTVAITTRQFRTWKKEEKIRKRRRIRSRRRKKKKRKAGHGTGESNREALHG